MQISVIIPAYNAAKYLNRCIESVANQDLPYDCYEAIVINDGSTDESIEILNTLCEKYSFLNVFASEYLLVMIINFKPVKVFFIKVYLLIFLLF